MNKSLNKSLNLNNLLNSNKPIKITLLASLMLVMPVYLWLQGSPPQPTETIESLQTHSEWMTTLQTKLKQDPNQAELWFQLGHGYLDNRDFSSALTCFDYAIRLNNKPSANQLAAKATALYYIKKQIITKEVEELLNQALILEPNNLTALTLIANDHFISFRYQQAVDIWTQLLDSNNPNMDRKSVILSLNQAKEML